MEEKLAMDAKALSSMKWNIKIAEDELDDYLEQLEKIENGKLPSFLR